MGGRSMLQVGDQVVKVSVNQSAKPFSKANPTLLTR